MGVKKLRIVPFKAQHVEGMKKRLEEGMIIDNPKWLEILEAGGPALTFYENDHLVFCFGIRRFWQGVGESWLICNDDINKYTRELLFYCHKYLDKAFNEVGFVRVQSPSRTNYPQTYRLLEKLGFQREGLMRKYGPDGQDYYIYGRIE